MKKSISRVFLAITVCVMTLLTSACGKDNTPFKHGSWSGKTYTSDFLGIKIQGGADWTVTSDESIAKNFDIPDMSESSIQTVFDKGRFITEMMMAKTDGTSINITVQDNDKSVSFTEKEYFTAGVDIVKKQFEALGYNCNVQKGNVNFLGKNTQCIELSLTISGTTVYEIQVPFFKSHYTASLTFGSLNKADLYSMLSMVTEI